MTKYAIYMLRFKNDKCYIGLDSKWPSRPGSHLKELRQGLHNNKRMQACFTKYGEPEVTQIATVLTKEALPQVEVMLIDLHGTYLNGLNSTRGGDGAFGAVRSEDTKKKMSDSVSGSKNHFYGKHHTEETLQKISLNSGSKRPEVREKMSKNRQGSGNPMFGKVYTAEEKAHMSAIMNTPEMKKHLSDKRKAYWAKWRQNRLLPEAS